MPTKLKDLKITKVDFVDQGANPDANIMLYKRKSPVQEGPGPEDDSELDRDDRSLMKRLIDAFRATFAPIEPGDGQVQKAATTFAEELATRNLSNIMDDMWNVCYALNNSLCSIICDPDLDAVQKQEAMLTSINAFADTTKQAVPSWAVGNSVGLVTKSAEAQDQTMADRVAGILADSLAALYAKAAPENHKTTNTNDTKGDQPDMKFDKSRMTPAERAMLEQLEKAYGVEDGTPAPAAAGEPSPTPQAKAAPTVAAAIESTERAAFAAATAPQAAAPAPDPQAAPETAPAADSDVYKGLPPEAAAELAALKKFREDAEDAALRQIASGYEIIGKKADDLFPILKSVKASSPAAYDQMIAALNDAKAAVEKSGIFGEVGKTGNGTTGRRGAVQEAESKAAELMKSKTGLTRAQALDQVLSADPELAERFENEEE